MGFILHIVALDRFVSRYFSSPQSVNSSFVQPIHSSVIWRMDNGSTTNCSSLSHRSKLKDKYRRENENCLQNFVL